MRENFEVVSGDDAMIGVISELPIPFELNERLWVASNNSVYVVNQARTLEDGSFWASAELEPYDAEADLRAAAEANFAWSVNDS